MGSCDRLDDTRHPATVINLTLCPSHQPLEFSRMCQNHLVGEFFPDCPACQNSLTNLFCVGGVDGRVGGQGKGGKEVGLGKIARPAHRSAVEGPCWPLWIDVIDLKGLGVNVSASSTATIVGVENGLPFCGRPSHVSVLVVSSSHRVPFPLK